MKLADLTIPSVDDCAGAHIEPMHAKLLIAPAETPEKVGSILLTASTHEKDVFREQRGRIVALGPVAFSFEDWPLTARKPQVGDIVLHEAYIGDLVEGEDGRKYRLVNDRAVMAVLERSHAKPYLGGFVPDGLALEAEATPGSIKFVQEESANGY